MKLDHESSEKLTQAVRDIVSKHLDMDQYQVFFFGSRVAGHAFERSDIDIGIDGPNPISPQAKFSIESDLEILPTLYKIDFVDFHDVSPDFKKVALQHVEPIN